MNTARIACLLAASLGLVACQAGGLGRLRAAQGGGTRDRVQLQASDLAAIDRYVAAGKGASNTRWILGDEVDVYASREYFSQVLTVNRGPWVKGSEQLQGDDRVITLRFLGPKGQQGAGQNPRVQIGTGLSVTARRILRVRLARTVNSNVPVRLHIQARGKAVIGHKQTVVRRGPALQMGGSLIRRGASYVWEPIG